MPIYEYICTECQHSHEALQSMSDAPLIECPACHRPTLKKRVSAAGFRFKGGGWYETDFKSGNQRNLADSGGGEKSGDTKPEEKAKASASKNDASSPKSDASSGQTSGQQEASAAATSISKGASASNKPLIS